MGIMEDTKKPGYWLDDADIDLIIYTLNKSDSEYKKISRDTIEYIFNRTITKEEIICLKDFDFIEKIIKNYSTSNKSIDESNPEIITNNETYKEDSDFPEESLTIKIDKIRKKHNIPETEKSSLNNCEDLVRKYLNVKSELILEQQKIDNLDLLKKELDEIQSKRYREDEKLLDYN